MARWSKGTQLLVLDEFSKQFPEEYVTVPCQCEHGNHSHHMVKARRLAKGGDLRGKLKLEDIEIPDTWGSPGRTM